jgi:hypothetical protein
MVGKKTVNIRISLDEVTVNADAGTSTGNELSECREGYFIGEEGKGRHDSIDDRPTDRVHPAIER